MSTEHVKPIPPKEKLVVGWREWVSLPDLDIARMKAKVDTGAQTSALHATAIKIVRIQGKSYVRFWTAPHQRSGSGKKKMQAPLWGNKKVKSSTGHITDRPTILTRLKLGNRVFPIKLTLVNRDLMGFRMLIGREALRKRFVVDSGRSYIQKKKKKKKTKITKK